MTPSLLFSLSFHTAPTPLFSGAYIKILNPDYRVLVGRPTALAPHRNNRKNLLGPRWKCSCQGLPCQQLSCPCKGSTWPETQYIQSANCHMPSQLWAFSLVLLSPNVVDYVTLDNQIFCLFFSSLFFIFDPIKASCLLPYFAVLWTFENRDWPLHEV